MVYFYISKIGVHKVPLMLSNCCMPFSVSRCFNYRLMKSGIWIKYYMQKYMSPSGC